MIHHSFVSKQSQDLNIGQEERKETPLTLHPKIQGCSKRAEMLRTTRNLSPCLRKYLAPDHGMGPYIYLSTYHTPFLAKKSQSIHQFQFFFFFSFFNMANLPTTEFRIHQIYSIRKS